MIGGNYEPRRQCRCGATGCPSVCSMTIFIAPLPTATNYPIVAPWMSGPLREMLQFKIAAAIRRKHFPLALTTAPPRVELRPKTPTSKRFVRAFAREPGRASPRVKRRAL